jgi:hypothetical protein
MAFPCRIRTCPRTPCRPSPSRFIPLGPPSKTPRDGDRRTALNHLLGPTTTVQAAGFRQIQITSNRGVVEPVARPASGRRHCLSSDGSFPHACSGGIRRFTPVTRGFTKPPNPRGPLPCAWTDSRSAHRWDHGFTRRTQSPRRCASSRGRRVPAADAPHTIDSVTTQAPRHDDPFLVVSRRHEARLQQTIAIPDPTALRRTGPAATGRPRLNPFG